MALPAMTGIDGSEFMLPAGRTYLNSGSLGPTPRTVYEAAVAAWQQLEQDPVSQGFGPLLEKMEETRRGAAKFLGCEVDEISLTRNTTEGMNSIAQGIDLQAGDRVLTTDQEHPGGALCWEYFRKYRGLGIDRIKLATGATDDAILARLDSALGKKTRVVSLSHVTFTTGQLLPIEKIAQRCRARGCLLVVDGAQSAGMLPVRLRELGCDAYATSGHKWLLGPKGTGLLYIRRSASEQIHPMTLFAGPRAYTGATGTRDMPSIIGLGGAIRFLDNIGSDRIQAHGLSLRKRLVTGLEKIPGVDIVGPSNKAATAIVSIRLTGDKKAPLIRRALAQQHDVIVKQLPAQVPNGLRISLHVHNDTADVDRLCAALKAVL
ncbi:MAG TPA: hypothetical protein DIT01_14425 [Lentisphaeria bacterium]|nr:hypothetical protein [Lentisphaeria bacterium]|tara:strand:- start:486 stop:1613 length:1128 start_codon:yes stop_codon:yes gene_type:complete